MTSSVLPVAINIALVARTRATNATLATNLKIHLFQNLRKRILRVHLCYAVPSYRKFTTLKINLRPRFRDFPMTLYHRASRFRAKDTSSVRGKSRDAFLRLLDSILRS